MKTKLLILSLLSMALSSFGAGLTISSGNGLGTNTTFFNSSNKVDYAHYTNFGSSGNTNLTLEMVLGSGQLAYPFMVSSTPGAADYGYFNVDPGHDGAPSPSHTEDGISSGRSIALAAGAAAREGRIQLGSRGWFLRVYFQPVINTTVVANSNQMSYSGLLQFLTSMSSNTVSFDRVPAITSFWDSTNNGALYEQRWSLDIVGDSPESESGVTSNNYARLGNRFFYGTIPSGVNFMGATFLGKLEGVKSNRFTVDTNFVNVEGPLGINQFGNNIGGSITNDSSHHLRLFDFDDGADNIVLQAGTMVANVGGFNGNAFVMNDGSMRMGSLEMRVGNTGAIRFNTASDNSGSFDAGITRWGTNTIAVTNNLVVTGGFASSSTNTLAVTSTGLTNNTTNDFLISITAGTAMSLKDQSGNQFLVPVLGSAYGLKPGWRFTGTAVTGTALQFP